MKIKEVRLSLGKTISLGNYEFMRVDVEMTTEILASTKTGFDRDYKTFSALVREKVNQELENIL